MVAIGREALLGEIHARLRASPIVSLLGPRQCGKTTLARTFASTSRATFLDLEDPSDLRRLAEPMTALSAYEGLVVIDEAQLKPEIFPVLRVLVDRPRSRTKFLLLGSVAPELVREISESLAGRVGMISMGGFSISEAGVKNQRRLWLRGGFPRSFLARSEKESVSWRKDFIQTFLERDLRRLGFDIPALTLRRFWTMVAHYHGQLWNGSEIGSSLGFAHTTVKRHLDILTGAYVMRQLPPWIENLSKRQIKSPKVYVRDSGLFHALQGVDTFAALESHPKLGASWEGFALEEALRAFGDRDAYFWATQSGAEMDLVLIRGDKRYGIEFKYADAPNATRSMAVAKEDLSLKRIFVVHPGTESYALNAYSQAIPLSALAELPRKLRW